MLQCCLIAVLIGGQSVGKNQFVWWTLGVLMCGFICSTFGISKMTYNSFLGLSTSHLKTCFLGIAHYFSNLSIFSTLTSLSSFLMSQKNYKSKHCKPRAIEHCTHARTNHTCKIYETHVENILSTFNASN
jgi:ABC-type branched-subunit amino acid transport system ATPase component